MAFKREIKTEYISESDNVWADNPFKEKDGKEKIHVFGTWFICTVRDEASGLLRSMSMTIAPQYAIDDKESQELIEQNFLTCEMHLKRDLKKKAEMV